jgi:hypothetical protein
MVHTRSDDKPRLSTDWSIYIYIYIYRVNIHINISLSRDNIYIVYIYLERKLHVQIRFSVYCIFYAIVRTIFGRKASTNVRWTLRSFPWGWPTTWSSSCRDYHNIYIYIYIYIYFLYISIYNTIYNELSSFIMLNVYYNTSEWYNIVFVWIYGYNIFSLGVFACKIYIYIYLISFISIYL